MPAAKLREVFGIDAPTTDGMNAVQACDGILDGRVRAMVMLGGNLVRALPDRERMEAAWPSLRLTVNIATKPNRTHLSPGEVSFILPCLGRGEEDIQASGPQAISIEDSLSHFHGSIGKATPPTRHLRSGVSIVAGMAAATLGPDPRLDWVGWTGDYALIRDLITRVFPDDFANCNARLFEPGGFYRGNPARDRVWRTESGKARFCTPTTLSALGNVPAGDDVLTLITLRSNDQFNTTIYGFSDRLRGLEGRDIVLMNPDEIARLGLTDGQTVTLVCAIGDGRGRRVGGLTLTAYDLPPGCVADYYPELNPPVPMEHLEKNSQTPAYKGTPVRIQA